MRSLGASEARNNLAEVLEQVHYGQERVAIDRRGKPFAALVPIEDLELLQSGEIERLRESEARLRSIMEHAPVEIYLKDAQGRYLEVNRRYKKTWGVTDEEVRGKLPGDVYEDKDFARAGRSHDLAVLESGQAIEGEDRTELDNGLRTLRVIKFPVRDDAGEVTGLGAITLDVTERKKAQQEVRKAQSLFEEAERLAKLGHWEWNEIENRCLHCSEGLASLFGISVEDYMTRMTSWEGDLVWIHPEDRMEVSKATRAARKKGTGFDIEYRIVRDDGETRDVREVATVHLDEGGTLVRSIGFVQDITEFKKVELALRESERASARAQRQARIGNWRWSVERDEFVSCSEEFARIHGIGMDAIHEEMNHQLERVIHPSDREWVGATFQRADDEGADYDIEYRIVRPDGEVRHVQEIGQCVLDPEGRVVELTGTVQDITDRKQAEEALRESQALLEQAAVMAHLGHWVWDEAEDRCIHCSETLAQLLGVTVEEYLADYGTSEAVLARVHPDDRQRYREAMARVDERAAPYDIEYRGRMANGEYRYLRERGEPVLDESGRLVRTVGTLQDITDYRRAEEELKRARDELELRVEERTAELRSVNVAMTREIAERKQAEEEAERSRELLHSAVEALDEGFVIFDAEDRLVLCNRKFRTIYWPVSQAWEPGVPLARVARDTAAACIGLSAEDDIEDWVQDHLEQHGQLGLHFDQPFADGRWIQAAQYPLPNGWTVGTRTDISEMKRAEQELRGSEAQLKQAQTMARVGTFVWDDVTNRCAFCSEELAHLLNMTVEEFMDKRGRHDVLLSLIHPDDRERYQQVLDGANESLEPYDVEYKVYDNDGNLHHWREIGQPQPDHSGRLGHTFGTVQDITDMRRAEKALRESEELFSKAFHASPALFAISRPEDGYHYDVNETWLDTLGYTREEAMAHSAVDLGVWADPDERARFIERLERDRSVRSFEARFRKKGGEELAMLISGEYLEIGNEPRLLVVSHDITERKRAEEARRVSEDRLRQATELAGLGYAIWDTAKDRCLYCSEEFARIHGTTAEHYMARASAMEGDWSFTHPDDRHLYKAAIERVRRGESVELEYRVHTPAGETRHVQEVIKPVFDEAGAIIQEYSTVQDITAIKKAEDELRESERRYRELFDESPVAIWEEDWSPIKQMLDDLAQGGVKDWRGYFSGRRDQLRTAYGLARITEISLATIDIYRAPNKEELARLSAADHVIDEELDAFLEILLSFLAGRMSVDIEAKDTGFDNSDFMVRRRVVIPPKYHGDWSRVIYAIEDITERARVEEQLRQAQKMEAVGQLTGGIAHDFNNLLAVVVGNAEFLEDQLGRDDRVVQGIMQAATRGAELTERLLAFSRRQPLHPQPIDLGALVENMTGLMKRTLGETIEIETARAPDLRKGLADPGQMENAVLNLAINARDAMPDGGRLAIEAGNTTLDGDASSQMEIPAGDYVVIAVSDTGTGMAPEVLEHVFEPFFTTKDVGEGSGLGLSMVYGFAKQSGGGVTIYSEPGHGTTVKLYLPRAEDGSGQTGQDAKPAAPPGQGEMILIVEDDPDVRTLAGRMLEGLGYRVAVAADAAAGLSALEDTPDTDLLLSDMVLPGGMGGLDFAKTARMRRPALKVLFMSGYTGSTVFQHNVQAEGAEILQKPFRKLDLAQRVRETLDE